jgi:hypothetical protein
MKLNAFCILAITAIFILISPALSQGDGHQGDMNGVGPSQGSFAPDQDPGIQDGGQPQDQAFDPQKMKNKKPKDNQVPGLPDIFAGTQPSNPGQGMDDKKPNGAEGKNKGPGPWVYEGAGPQEPKGPNPGDEGLGNPFMGDREGPRPLMDEHRHEMPPKKSIMDGHKKMHRPLIDKNKPELPPKKSIMPKAHKKMPRPLMGDPLPKLPPMKPIKDFQG